MSGLKVKRIVWTVIFLTITLVAIVMEVVAGIFHPAGTIPWTEYLAQYVPWPIQLAAYVAFAAWLPFHFWRADQKRRVAYRAGQVDATLDLKVEHASRIRDANQVGYADGFLDGSAGKSHRDAR